MELAKIQPAKMKAIRPKSERLAEALEKGLQIPWMGVRPDLMLHKGTLRAEGGESYILEDPVTGGHFELGEAEAKFFLCLVTEKDLKSAVNKLLRTTSLRPSVEDILSFIKMLQLEKLAVRPSRTLSGEVEDDREKLKDPRKKFSIRKIFFFRIPIVRPDNFLNAVHPWLSPLWSKPFLYLYAVLGMVGFISVIQQIELYFHSVNLLFTPYGAVTFVVCLYFLKLMHELGHALTAKHYGLYVRRMGIYMMLFTPMLYTDTTEGWKLPSRRGRLNIGAAGVMVEFYVACVSLFLWSILPDGMFRSLMFYMSGASLISTLLVNINPFMRFDGYYLLMDYMRISNLRTRSTQMFKHFVRRVFFDWQGAKPEEHPKYQQMVIFGFFVNVYLVFITISIGLTFYHTVSKLLGIYSMCIGFTIFYGGAVFKEIVYVIKNRKNMGSKLRVCGTVALLCLAVTYLFYPLPQTEKLPSVFVFEDVAALEAVGNGKIITEIPPVGTRVTEGDVLLRVHDDALEQELKKYQYDLAQVETTIKYMGSSGEQGGYRKWLLAERLRLDAAIGKIRQAFSHMEIRAPISGQILDVNEALRPGSYVSKDSYLLTVGNRENWEIRAYAKETVYRDLKKTGIAGGEIIFQDLETSLTEARFREMLDFPVVEFPNKSVYDYAGGEIPSFQSASGKIVPKLPYYPIIFDSFDLPIFIRHGTGCVVRVKGKTVSLVGELIEEAWRFMASEGFI